MHQIHKYCFFLLLCLITPHYLEASSNCTPWIAKVVSIQGKVDTRQTESTYWNTLLQDDTICLGDKVRTSKHSRATLLLSNNTFINLNQNTTLNFPAPLANTSSWFINLLEGTAFFRSRQQQQLNIQTPFINAVHEGTEFLVTVSKQQATISVFDGQVSASNKLGKVSIKKGFKGVANNNAPPRLQTLKVNLEDAVQWTLYYPPIIDIQDHQSTFQPALNAYQQGNIQQAIALLDSTTEKPTNTSYLSLKSSLLLSIGRVDEASTLLDSLLKLESKNSTAFALQSIIAITKNQKDKALLLAQQAVTLNPQSAVAHIALSYAHQAHFDIASAQSSVETAVNLSPKNSLAWARLAELQLSSADHRNALKSATKALHLNPVLSQPHTIQGFSYLSQTKIPKAITAFSNAITLNSANPLARLGLGLAKIRKGDIKAGTHDIETAASLSPDNAIIRCYLGKAYYELKNENYATTELTIAKELDPKDPTPWFYDAIIKQSTNRPVKALHDMQKAIELNNNRGVYRSKLLLDEDAAARSANITRIYQTLDLERVALKHAWTSLNQDYTNSSSHRHLSDSLLGKPRHRIARASELLQAQLFQAINTVPVQPQLTSENISILNSTGPGSLSSNEYDPLFTTNGAHILLNGAYGSNNTLTDSAIITGVYNNLSLSMGQFHYQTDGFRVNDDYKQNVYNAFAQLAINSDLNLQLEFKREDVSAGDVPTRFDEVHQQNLRQATDQDTTRFGLHYKINAEQDFIFSSIYTHFKEQQNNSNSTFTSSSGFTGTLETTTTIKENNTFDEQGYQLEAQHLFHPASVDIISGVGFLNLDAKIPNTTQTYTTGEFFSNVFFIPSGPTNPTSSTSVTNRDSETNYFNGYIYTTIELNKEVITSLGLSFDSYNDGLYDTNQFNPKIGLTWTPLNKLTLRAAAFRNLKRPLAARQTIEPTQVAGFNQFFDDNDGSSAWRYGFGIDYQPFKNIFLGGEISWRKTRQPVISSNVANLKNRDESSHLAYLYWTINQWLAFSSEYKFDEFRREKIAQSASLGSFVTELSSHKVPLSINIHHASGLFSNFSTTYINQNISFVNGNSINQSSNQFWLFESSIGFRFPKKLGSISFEVNNIFDNNNFQYHSTFDASGAQLTDFVPEREIFVKLNIAY